MAIETPRMQQLKKLSAGMPVANQQVAQGLQQAQTTQMQAAIGAAKPGMGIQAAQQMGGQVAAQRGQIQQQAQQQTQQQAGQIAQVGLGQQAVQNQAQLGRQESALSGRQRQQAQQLNALDNRMKSELLDKQLSFAKDENGRTLLNSRQLADVAILNAKNAEEFANYKQQATQVQQRKLQAMQFGYDKLRQLLETGVDANGRRLDQATKLQIQEITKNAEKMIRDEQARIANNTAMWGAAGTIAGAVIGGIAGGPQGAQAGASAGSAGGSFIGSQG